MRFIQLCSVAATSRDVLRPAAAHAVQLEVHGRHVLADRLQRLRVVAAAVGVHEGEALRAVQPFLQRRHQQVRVGQEDDARIEAAAGQLRVEGVQYLDVEVERARGAAAVALALVVVGVVEPDVQVVDVAVRLGVVGDADDHAPLDLGVGVAEGRQHGLAPEHVAPAGHQGDLLAELLRQVVHLHPADAGHAERLRVPAVADGVVEQPAPRDLALDDARELARHAALDRLRALAGRVVARANTTGRRRRSRPGTACRTR